VPLAGFTLWSRRRWLPAIAIPCTIGIFIALTAWVIRPRAPTGRDHPEHLKQGVDVLRRVEASALVEALPNRWTEVRAEDPSAVEWCVDSYGRERGAAYSGINIRLQPGLSSEDAEALREAFVRRGWTVSLVEADAMGGPAHDLVIERNGYFINGGHIWSDGHVDPLTLLNARTPCLRTQ
jgi:hypothetical protein